MLNTSKDLLKSQNNPMTPSRPAQGTNNTRYKVINGTSTFTKTKTGYQTIIYYLLSDQLPLLSSK